MKKTLTVNLGGTVYHIDEDAYNLLDNYLTNLRIHFRREEGAEEIVHDMELRISELFTGRLDDSKQVITIEDVEEIIAQMGKPEELSGEEGEEASQKKETKRESAPRRLYRDPDNKILGGVASGLSAYLGWDVTWVRIAFLILMFLLKGFAIVYIIAWIIIPLARTATEKLAMRGEKVNVESIGKTVTDGFERVSDDIRSDHPQTFLQKMGEGIVAVAGFMIKFLLILIAICCAPVIFALLIVCFVLLMVATGLLAAMPTVIYELSSAFPELDWASAGASPVYTIGLAVAGILVIGIPIVGLIHMLMRHFGGWQPMSTAARTIFIVLWLIALSFGFFFAYHAPFIASVLPLSW